MKSNNFFAGVSTRAGIVSGYYPTKKQGPKFAEASFVSVCPKFAEASFVSVCPKFAEASFVPICPKFAKASFVPVCPKFAKASFVPTVFYNALHAL